MRSGFRVLSVGGDAMVVTRTFQYAEAAHARLNLISAKCERELVQDGAADLVGRCRPGPGAQSP